MSGIVPMIPTEERLAAILDRAQKATKGDWKRIAQGGCSTVVCPTRPPRNDTRIPAYAYDESRGHCLAYPFIEDDGRTRLDFVSFSHADADFIAHAHQDVPFLLQEIRRVTDDNQQAINLANQKSSEITKLQQQIALLNNEIEELPQRAHRHVRPDRD